MGRQVALARETTIADLAHVGPFSRVTPPVDGQRRPLRESFRALVAFIRFLPCVHPSVHPEIFRIGETFATDVAHVRFLPCVDAPVLLQMFRAAQTLAAVIAQVQFRGVVALLVPEQGSLGGENSAADIASRARHFVRLHLRVHASAMGGELSSEIEGGPAQLAGERLVARVYVVMLLQIDRFAETFVAVVALEGQIVLVGVPEHVDAQCGQHRGLVVALLAHVAWVEVGLLVPGQVAEQAELFGAVFASEVADRVPHQVLLIVALVSEHLVARFTDELHLGLLFLHLYVGTVSNRGRVVARLAATAAFPPVVLLHVFAQVHVRSEHPSTLVASVLPFALVLDLVIVE